MYHIDCFGPCILSPLPLIMSHPPIPDCHTINDSAFESQYHGEHFDVLTSGVALSSDPLNRELVFSPSALSSAWLLLCSVCTTGIALLPIYRR